MKKYEVMYIINASVEEDKRAALINDLSKIITNQGGKVVKTDEWGMRDFAYRIDDMTKGFEKRMSNQGTIKKYLDILEKLENKYQ